MKKISPEVVNWRIESFENRFGKAHLYLAYHAAFPLALTPDLLYRLWVNFQRDINGEVLNIPWIAVADLLLSSLCNEVGYELYEMDLAVRNLLLSRLQKYEKFGQKRINELSDFLLEYVKLKLHSDDPDTYELAQSQRWVALAYTQPSQAAHELALTFSKLDLKNKAELIRLASLTETFTEELAEFQPLLIYAYAMGKFARGSVELATNQLREALDINNELQILGIFLPIPEEINTNFLQPKVLPSKQKLSFIYLLKYWGFPPDIVSSLILLLSISLLSHSVSPQIYTPIPSPTPSLQLSSLRPTLVDRLSPEEAIQTYFTKINQGQYQAAWNQLSPSYQNNKNLHPDGYLSYIEWWGRKVKSVDIEQISLVETTAQTATVNAKFKYLMNTGKVIPASVRFFLLWDAQNSRWIVSDSK